MTFTDFHAKLVAHELTRRCATGSVDQLASVLADAQVDLNPHQIEAALFALSNPLSKGVILADEVGLGKTIEAGLLLSQKWAERRRRLLVITPANLRKQWSQELEDKFHLPSVILEKKSFNEALRAGNLNPFQQSLIVICSYQFIKSQEHHVKQATWDLVVVDEAHRLRNVYKASSKIARSIKNAISIPPKVLLTATPLQNSLLELYGLVSIIDEFTFGDQKSFQSRFIRLADKSDFEDLKLRLAPLCKRTLRRQVLEYIKYTNRHAIVQEFVPSNEEQRLYDKVSEYLQGETLYAMPSGQRQLMTLMLRKLLASSTFAITPTLDGLVRRLEQSVSKHERVSAPPDELLDDYEGFEEEADEWNGDEASQPKDGVPSNPDQVGAIHDEAAKLREYYELAKSILKNSKGEVLLTALRRGFAASQDAQTNQGAPRLQQKAVIFTESKRTQDYLFRILGETEFAGKIVLFNGTNSDLSSKAIYENWLKKHAGTDRISGSPSADKRAALVEHFRDEAQILIATEAAAEGMNLQFCNLVVNYDLPWNPQRIEQRIGRCHRYGQKFDVVVVNFLNKSNAADQRVYELLSEKFRLFDGVFGASDDVLGAIESGVDFEKQIANIYQKCRTPEQIAFEFDQLQSSLETEIQEGNSDAREKLFDNFDQDVIERVKVQSARSLDRFNDMLWDLTRYILDCNADFNDEELSFLLHSSPFSGAAVHPGPYRMGRDVQDANTYRIGHPLAQRVLDKAMQLETKAARVTFNSHASRKNIAALEPIVGQEGWLVCQRLTVKSAESEDHLVLAGLTDYGELLEANQCRRLFDLPAEVGETVEIHKEAAKELDQALTRAGSAIGSEMSQRDGRWFDEEMAKLDRWADDRRSTLKVDIDNLEDRIKHIKTAIRLAPTVQEKLEQERERKNLETKRHEAWKDLEEASQRIEREKDALLDETSRRLRQETKAETLFTVRWALV